jgi:hypothetical protein
MEVFNYFWNDYFPKDILTQLQWKSIQSTTIQCTYTKQYFLNQIS